LRNYHFPALAQFGVTAFHARNRDSIPPGITKNIFQACDQDPKHYGNDNVVIIFYFDFRNESNSVAEDLAFPHQSHILNCAHFVPVKVKYLQIVPNKTKSIKK